MALKRAHNPTPEERDEKFSLYGLDPETVGEVLLNAPPEKPEKEERPPERPKRGGRGRP